MRGQGSEEDEGSWGGRLKREAEYVTLEGSMRKVAIE